MRAKDITLSDGFVTLSPFTDRHANGRYLSWFSDPEVARFIVNRPADLATARRYVTEKLLDHNCRFLSIYVRQERIGTLKL